MKIIDMHCDTITEIADHPGRILRENEGHLDLIRMKKAGYMLQNFALYVDCGKYKEPWNRVMDLYEVYKGEIDRNSDLILPVTSYEQIVENDRKNLMSALLTVEEGAVCEGEIEKLHKLYDCGVRMLTLTWNYENELGYSHKFSCGINGDDKKFRILGNQFGLKEKGIEFIEEMNRIGMIPDVSHLSDQGFKDVLKYSKRPFVASHSNARSLCSHTRNMTDSMIKQLSDKGGVIGLNFYHSFLRNQKTSEVETGTGYVRGKESKGMLCSIEDFVRHAKHIVNVGGIECLGLGSDFDGIATNEAVRGVQDMEILWNALTKAGFTQNESDKIFHKNVLRIYKEWL